MEFSWSALWNITDETPDNCQMFLECNGMNLFLECLKVRGRSLAVLGTLAYCCGLCTAVFGRFGWIKANSSVSAVQLNKCECFNLNHTRKAALSVYAVFQTHPG